MKRRILFVEDNDYKRNKIVDYLAATFPEIETVESRSYSSCVQKMEESTFDLLLLDVSLPTYDISPTETGGRFRTFAGRELARRAIRQDTISKIIFITQYKSFSERGNSYSFDELALHLEKDCGAKFGGAIFFDGSISSWKQKLTDAIEALTQ